MKRVFIACEFSAIVRNAFRALGFDAWSCDLLETEGDPRFHIQGNVLDYLDRGWDLMIAHPPCTYLSRSGWRWVNAPDSDVLPLKGEPRRRAAFEAAEFFLTLLNYDKIPYRAIENPRPICHVNLPPSSQHIQPWQFGVGEVKETHLWLRGLPPLVPTNIVDGRDPRIHRMPPGKNRSLERSRTFPEIAAAMASQWGGVLNQ